MAYAKTVAINLCRFAVASATAMGTGAPAEAANYVVGPVSYSMLGSNNVNSTPSSLVFAPFNAPVPASNLTAVRLFSNSTGTFGGTAALVNLNPAAGTNYSFTGTPFFRFSNNQSLAGTAAQGILTPSFTSSGIGTVAFSSVSGGYPGANFTTSVIPVNTNALRTYFTTGSPTIDFYNIAYSVNSGPTAGATDFSTATFSGQLYVAYEYSPVPAPAVVTGAVAAFAFTRRLKAQSKRIHDLRNSVKL
jgi:hypothetical protein